MVAASALLAAGCSETATDDAAAGADRQASLPELAGKVLLSGCRQGQCAWLRVASIERIRSTPDGELRRLVARRGFSRYGFDSEPPSTFADDIEVEWEPRDMPAFAFCSTARPAYAFADEEGGLILHRLDLFDLAGYQTASAGMYMRICHDRDLAVEGDAALARLGYRAGTPSEQLELASPDDIVRP